jgi:hypothetical protein
MRSFPIFCLIVIIASALMTIKSFAMPMTKVHVLQNLNTSEARLAKKIIERNGYQLTDGPIFSASEKTVVITKANGDELEPASIQVEIIQKNDSDSIPKSIFNLKLETNNLSEVLEKLPSPSQLGATPVAYQQ